MELKDLTRQIVHTKEMQIAADRLIAIGLHQAPGLVRKATVPAVGTGDAPSLVTADPEATTLVNAVQRQSIFGRLATLGAIAVPVHSPLPFGDTDPQPVWVGEGLPRPVGHFTTTATATTSSSYSLLLVFTREFLKLGNPRSRNLVLSRAVRGLARADDGVFVSDDAATAASPAGILWNRSPIGAGSPGDLQSDLENLFASVSDGRPFSPVFLLSGRAAVYLSASDGQAFKDLNAVTGGVIAGIPCVISPAAGANLILLDASELAISDAGVNVSTSEHASLQLVDGTPTPGPVQMTSLFQSNSVAMKFERFLSWVLLRSDAVAYVSLPIGGVTPMREEDVELVTSGVAVVMKDLLKARDQRIAALEAKLAVLETKTVNGGVKWHGVWEAGTSYREGVLCTRSGSLWLATQDTTATPGESPAWVLVVKRGRAE